MRIGIPKETKIHEYRVSMVPAGVRELVSEGHEVLVEQTAGHDIGIDDKDYREAGARLVDSAEEVFRGSDLIVKVKEPSLEECAWLTAGQSLFTYLHLAAAPDLARQLLDSGVSAIAYETVTTPNGFLPLLAPMSEVAGRMSIQVGAACLQKSVGGSGTLLGGVPGVLPGKVLILGGGTSGTHAAEMALGLKANVTVLDRSLRRIRELSEHFEGRVNVAYSTQTLIEELVSEADLVVGAVLVTGARAPRLVSEQMLETMRPGSALVDIAIDQGGCFATSRPTSHADPTFIQDGIVHYCVTNMPGAVARTSTLALTNATLPYILKLTRAGISAALEQDDGLRAGLNVHEGHITHGALAQSLGDL